jgi:hypothetical protein
LVYQISRQQYEIRATVETVEVIQRFAKHPVGAHNPLVQVAIGADVGVGKLSDEHAWILAVLIAAWQIRHTAHFTRLG